MYFPAIGLKDNKFNFNGCGGLWSSLIHGHNRIY